ncbi:MAG TPA: 1-deoxy-D-xylulose-5-phosphate reductoisomerase [Acidimicrobiales bacterium]|jgi:1-deoxy-D-xylulose-5-phosphate reductoisomerase|nr:1-deoxy-D-xylulose-5-phosphate reductoisomerase [Acidimicrobiales bacterium]
MRTVSLVGSTGSIGTQAAEVILAEPDRYRVVALGASTSVERLAEQAHRLRPERVALADASRAGDLERLVPAGTEVLAGPDSLAAIATGADVVVNGVVGFAGLPVTLATLEAGARLALANKESLIAAGPVVQRARATAGAEIVPVDSEHCAIHQCLRAAGDRRRVARLVLTASGGPFRGRSAADLAGVTLADALAHPTWTMGPKVTIDSSTLMNKGLEVIEAHELFAVAFDAIDVVVHPQSIVHSMVEFSDGATLAQLSQPDMRLPIGYALAYPDRAGVAFGALDWTQAARLDFEPPDGGAFPCLGLAYQAGRTGGTAPAWLNAANEVAVEAFRKGLIPWAAIADVIKETLEGHDGAAPDDLAAVHEADRRARVRAREAVQQRSEARVAG